MVPDFGLVALGRCRAQIKSKTEWPTAPLLVTGRRWTPVERAQWRRTRTDTTQCEHFGLGFWFCPIVQHFLIYVSLLKETMTAKITRTRYRHLESWITTLCHLWKEAPYRPTRLIIVDRSSVYTRFSCRPRGKLSGPPMVVYHALSCFLACKRNTHLFHFWFDRCLDHINTLWNKEDALHSISVFHVTNCVLLVRPSWKWMEE